jgi:hypothetical protein
MPSIAEHKCYVIGRHINPDRLVGLGKIAEHKSDPGTRIKNLDTSGNPLSNPVYRPLPKSGLVRHPRILAMSSVVV